MTTTTTSKRPATKRASKAERKPNDSLSAVEQSAADAIGKLSAGTITSAEAIAEAHTLVATIQRRDVRDTIAVGALVGTVAIMSHEAPKVDGKAGKLPSAADVADSFLRTTVGKDCGWQRGTIVQYVNMARVPERHAVINLWFTFGANDKARQSDPKAYTFNTIGFLRFASAWKAKRVGADGVIFATKADSVKPEGEAITAAVASAASSEVAQARARREHTANVRKARAEASASDAMIGKIHVADVAALTKAQRERLSDLLKSLS